MFRTIVSIVFLYNNNDDQVNLLYEMNLFNKLHDDFKLGKEGWSKFWISNYKAQEWELYDNVCVFSSVQIEEKKMEIDLLDLSQEYCDMQEINRKFTYSFEKNYFIFYLFGKKKEIDLFDDLKVFDKLHGKYKLKSYGWSRFLAGYIPQQNVNFDSSFVFRIIKIEQI